MSDDGLTDKFYVKRLTESSRGIDHEECFYFVLDPKHDKAAMEALIFYANAPEIRLFNPELSRDLLQMAATIMNEQIDEDEVVGGYLKGGKRDGEG